MGFLFEPQYREEELQSAVLKVLERVQAELSDGNIGVSEIRRNFGAKMKSFSLCMKRKIQEVK